MAHKQIVRYKENPFEIELQVKTKRKSIQLAPLGADSNVAIVDIDSGEVKGQEIVSYQKVDTTKFVKIYTSQIGMIFNLSSAANKAFQILMWQSQKRPNETLVELSQYTLEDFVEENYTLAKKNNNVFGFQEKSFEPDKASTYDSMKLKGYSIAVFRKGVSELVDNKIIAASTKVARYHINPAMIFNGSRMSYTHIVDIDTSKSMELEHDE